MKYIALLLGLACIAAVPLTAEAAGTSANLSWVHPTQYIDNTPLAVSDIQETVVEWKRPGSEAVVGSVRVTAPAKTATVTDLVCGNFEFTAKTIMKAAATSSASSSPPASYSTGVACTANPPTGLVAT